MDKIELWYIPERNLVVEQYPTGYSLVMPLEFEYPPKALEGKLLADGKTLIITTWAPGIVRADYKNATLIGEL